MRIGIDARLWKETGVGRYIRALTTELVKLDRKNEYVLFLRKPEFESLQFPANWRKVLADVHWHTMTEQLALPLIYRSARVDLLHIPYFSVPLFTSRPFIVTIHDLTISHFATGKATTKPYFLYLIKRLGYQFILSQAVKRATQLITVSETVKKQLVQEFSLNPGKVTVTYEAGDLEVDKSGGLNTPSLYLLYVGNAHPHKNVVFLIDAFNKLRRRFPKLQLVLIGKKDFFYQRLTDTIRRKDLESDVVLPGEVSNADLSLWYSHAAALVFPSLSEGFGIPGLEAMRMSCPVVASDISVFHEIYGGSAIYFNPRETSDLVEKLTALLNNISLRKKLITQGKEKAAEYSWQKMAEETLSLYESCTRLRSGK